MNKNTCINPKIIVINTLNSKNLGFGDDLMELQAAIQNAYAFHTDPQEIIDIVHPKSIKADNTLYNQKMERLIKIRVHASIKHKICFKMIDFAHKKIHHVKDNQYICYPLQEDDLFSTELQKFLIKYFKQNPLDTKRDWDTCQYVAKLQQNLLDFDNRVCTFDTSDMNINIFQHKTYIYLC